MDKDRILNRALFRSGFAKTHSESKFFKSNGVNGKINKGFKRIINNTATPRPKR